MELADHPHPIVLITILLGLSQSFAWDRNVRRYESYDLERGPVLYEAYYPDASDNKFSTRRYLDHGPVLERTFQVPSDGSPETSPIDAYRDGSRQVPLVNGYPVSEFPRAIGYFGAQRSGLADERERVDDARNFLAIGDPDFPNASNRPEDTEPSSVSRRDVANDVENFVPSYGYVGGAKYGVEPPGYPRRVLRLESRGTGQIEPEINGEPFAGSFRPATRTQDGNLYEEVRQRENEPFARFSRRFDDLYPVGYQRSTRVYNADPRAIRREGGIERQELANDPEPPENIFEPRPQIINYVFSGPSSKVVEDRAGKKTGRQDAAEGSTPRSYGDNLVRDEIEEKKAQGRDDAKVASIEVSEVPRHKTRHHHGEWMKRDYPRKHRA